jgi:cobyrinic acid a,c-diamide synthase
MSARGLVIAAPASGTGKTTVTLGLLRALRDRGLSVVGAKSGPDYIDPALHAAACGQPSVNLDAWAMPPDRLRALAAGQPGDLLIVEGAMGVLDAAADGRGSAADLAAALGLPLVLVLAIDGQGQSAALAPAGLRALRPGLPLAGVILNRAASPRHAALARRGLEAAGAPVLGAVPRTAELALPSRHLGLVLPGEIAGLEATLARAAATIATAVDLDALLAAARPLAPPGAAAPRLPPLGQRIAVALDASFAFAYPHLLADWHAAGASIAPFAPLADEAPASDADAIFLPGGYPELHAGALAAAETFAAGIRAAAARGARIYGECGGFMALGDALTDAEGRAHAMLGLLPLATSFAERRLTLGYRRLSPRPGAPWAQPLAGHEFHYATITASGPGEALFHATDATGDTLGPMGLMRGSVSGSFAHVIGPMI